MGGHQSRKGGPTIDDYIANQQDDVRPVLAELRALVNHTVPGLEEAVMWGNPVFRSGKEKVAFFYVAGDHVNFGFFRATELRDPKHLLEGTGKGMRHIKVRNIADIDEKAFGSLLKQAARLPPR